MDIYEILGVDASAESREIKRAYAQRLKQCDPAKEPERFQALRAAYEQALAWSQFRAQAPAEAPTDVRTWEAPQVIEPLQEMARQDALTVSANASLPEKKEEERGEAVLGSGEASVLPEVAPMDPMALADAALARLISHYANREAVADAGVVLARSLDSIWLDSLEAMEHFEQMLLGWIFSPPLKIDMLDAAADRFRWETANRHLHHWRPDLAWRLKRHLDLRVAIASLGANGKLLTSAMDWFHREGPPRRPSTTPAQLARLADTLNALRSSFGDELQERYGDGLVYFSRLIKDRANENNVAGAGSVAHESDHQSGDGRFWRIIWLIFVILMIVRTISNSSRPPQSQSIPMANSSTCTLTDEEILKRTAMGGNIRAYLPPDCMSRAGELLLRTIQTGEGSTQDKGGVTPSRDLVPRRDN